MCNMLAFLAVYGGFGWPFWLFMVVFGAIALHTFGVQVRIKIVWQRLRVSPASMRSITMGHTITGAQKHSDSL